MNIIKTRAVVSSILLILFLIVSITGIGLWLSPSKAGETNWTFFTLNREKLANLHTISGFGMVFVIFVHLLLNYKMYLNEVKS